MRNVPIPTNKFVKVRSIRVKTNKRGEITGLDILRDGPAPKAARKRNPMRYGTSYFVTKASAIRYYRAYEHDPKAAVERKLREGQIHIGRPPLKAGQRTQIIRGEGRYEIVENAGRFSARKSKKRLKKAGFYVSSGTMRVLKKPRSKKR